MSKYSITNSISKKITLYIITCFAIPYILVTLYTNRFLEKSMNDNITASTENYLKSTANMVDHLIYEEISNELEALAHNSFIKRADSTLGKHTSTVENDIVATLITAKTSCEEIESTYVALSDGAYVSYPSTASSKDYDPRTLPWYQDAIKAQGQVVISAPYVTDNTHKTVFTLSQSIKLDNGRPAVVSVVVSLDAVQNTFASTTVGRTGRLLLVDAHGYVITSPFGKTTLLKPISDIGIPEFKTLHTQLEKFTPFTYDGYPKMIYTALAPKSGWTVAVVYESSEFWLQPYNLTWFVITLFSLALALVIMTVRLVLQHTTAPLLQLVDVVDRVEYLGDDLTHLNDKILLFSKRDDEIGLIGKAILNLILSLKSILAEDPQKIELYQRLKQTHNFELTHQTHGASDTLVSQSMLLTLNNLLLEREAEQILLANAKSLQSNEEHLRLTHEASQDGSFDLLLDQNKAYMDFRLAELLEIPIPDEEMTIVTLLDLLTAAGLHDLHEFVEQAITDRPAEMVWSGKRTPVTTQQGIWFKAWLHILPADKTVPPHRLIGILRDESAERQNEIHFKKINEELELKVKARTQELLALNKELQASSLEIQNSIDNFHREIIERIKAEAQLEHANKELEEMVATLRDTENQLVRSEKLASLGILISGVAHEVNTPIGISVTASSYLYKTNKDFHVKYANGHATMKDVVEYLRDSDEAVEIIQKNLENAARLINSFKNLSTDQSDEIRRPFNLGIYIDEILHSLQPKYKHTGHQILVECAPNVMINSYPGAFSQILTNLVMNSLGHAFEGKPHGQITIRVQKDANTLILTYQDNGHGIPEEFIRKIFDPFFTTKRGSGGTGLGLFVVHNIVTQQLGGEITCTSMPGEGTTFVMHFNEI